MARLLDWPRGLGKISYQRLSGPRTAGSSSSESLTGYVQTVASVFGAWRYQIALPAIHRRLLRLYRGMVTGLHGGANAVRVPFDDPDVISFADAGIVDIPEGQTHPEVPFSNGERFSNGCNWGVSRPQVAVAQDAAKGDTVIYLEDDYWGHDLIGGEWLAFMPLHFGKYEVTERITPGQYRIAMPLRKALVAGETYARLDNIVLAMRLEGEAAGTVQRGVVVSEGNTLTMVEVMDEDVRAFFAD